MNSEDSSHSAGNHQVIGRCRFCDLPEHYQQVFENGANKANNVLFVPEKNLESVVLGIPFYGLFALIPAILMNDYQRFFGGWRHVGWIPLLIVLWFGIRAIQNLLAHYRAKKQGIEQYGLLLDHDYLVQREIAMLNPWCCLIIPRSNVLRYYTKSEGGGSGGGYRMLNLEVAYLDNNARRQSLKLGSASSLAIPPYRLDKILADFGS